MKFLYLILALLCLRNAYAQDEPIGEMWKIHSIDQSLFGADGVKVKQSGKYTYFAVPWEQSGVSVVYRYSDKLVLLDTFHCETIGAEDAVLEDLDQDGELDLVAASDEPGLMISIHYSALNIAEREKVCLAKKPKTQWMFAEIADMDQDGKPDIVAGAKKENATLSLFLNKGKRKWKRIDIAPIGWTMSLKCVDMDGDNDIDILVSDRDYANSGIKWYENPGPKAIKSTWEEHSIGLKNKHPMFLNLYVKDGVSTILASEIEDGFFRFTSTDAKTWEAEKLFSVPSFAGKWTKDILYAEINGQDGPEIVTNYNHAIGKYGVIWSEMVNGAWVHHNISGTDGPKFDLMIAIDMDLDQDLDILTTEENDNSDSEAGLGFIWYENPQK